MNYTPRNINGYGWSYDAIYENRKNNPLYYTFGCKQGLSFSDITNNLTRKLSSDFLSIFNKTIPSYYGTNDLQTKNLIIEDDVLSLIDNSIVIPSKEELEKLINSRRGNIVVNENGMKIGFVDYHDVVRTISIPSNGYFTATISNNMVTFYRNGVIVQNGTEYCTEYRLLTSTFNNVTNSYYYFYCQSTPNFEYDSSDKLVSITWSNPITGFTSEMHISRRENFYMVLPLHRDLDVAYTFDGKITINNEFLDSYDQELNTTSIPYFMIGNNKPLIENGLFNTTINPNITNALFEAEYKVRNNVNGSLKLNNSITLNNNTITFDGGSLIFEKINDETDNIPSVFIKKNNKLYFNIRELYSVNAYTSNHVLNFNFNYIFEPDYTGLVLPSIYKPFYVNQILSVDDKLQLQMDRTVYNGIGIGYKTGNKKTKYRAGYLLCGINISLKKDEVQEISSQVVSSQMSIERSKPLLLCDYKESISQNCGYSGAIGYAALENILPDVMRNFNINTNFLSNTYNNYNDEQVSVNENLISIDLLPNQSMYYSGVNFINSEEPFLESTNEDGSVDIPFFKNRFIEMAHKTGVGFTLILGNQENEFVKHLKDVKNSKNIRYYAINKAFYDNYIDNKYNSTYVDVYLNNREYFDLNPHKFLYEEIVEDEDSTKIIIGGQTITGFTSHPDSNIYKSGWRKNNQTPRLPFLNMYSALQSYNSRDYYRPASDFLPYAHEIIDENFYIPYIYNEKKPEELGIYIIGCYSPLTCLNGHLFETDSDYSQEVNYGNKIIPQMNYTSIIMVYKISTGYYSVSAN